jgi:hypothetical protein
MAELYPFGDPLHQVTPTKTPLLMNQLELAKENKKALQNQL